MLGIGAAHRLDPNGIAWKQNKDFENLLKRLNGDVVEGGVVEGFKNSGGTGDVEEETSDAQDEAKKKRKRDVSKEAPKRKKKKIEKEDEGEENSRADEPISLPSERDTASSGSSERKRTVPTLPRHRAYAFLIVLPLLIEPGILGIVHGQLQLKICLRNLPPTYQKFWA